MWLIGELDESFTHRAKDTDGEWQLGHIAPLIGAGPGHYVIERELWISKNNSVYTGIRKMVQVDTICRCTGTKDSTGTMVFENDLLKDDFSGAIAQIRFGKYKQPGDDKFTEHIGFYVDWQGELARKMRKDLGFWINKAKAKIVGNTIDNQDLLEEQDGR